MNKLRRYIIACFGALSWKFNSPWFVCAYCLLFLVGGCDSLVQDVDIPVGKSRIVVSAFISQQAPVSVVLNNNIPLNSNPNSISTYIDNAIVLLNQDTLKKATGDVAYTNSGLAILSNTAYTLHVTAPDGRFVSTSIVTLADTVPDFTVKFDSSMVDEHMLFYFLVDFPDFPNIKNFYRIFIEVVSSDSSRYVVNDYADEESTPDITDLNQDGKMIRYISNRFRNWTEDATHQYARILLLHVDEHYYKFHNSARKSGFYNPLTEPILVYSNVGGGLGAFGCYVAREKKFLF